MPKIRKDVLSMNELQKEYCNHISIITGESMERIEEGMRQFAFAVGRATGINERFKMLTTNESEEKIIGNKRNGAQDRRQAFGSLF